MCNPGEGVLTAGRENMLRTVVVIGQPATTDDTDDTDDGDR